jgi:hypothetical protein
MNTPLRSTRWHVRAARLAIGGLAAGGMALAMADTPIPDPPVPAEAPMLLAAADAPHERDCACDALRVHDLQSQIDRHVEQWQAMHHKPRMKPAHRLGAGHLVEGVVGFPVRHYRLAADEDGTAKP